MAEYILKVGIPIALKSILPSYNLRNLRSLYGRHILVRKSYTTLMIFHVIKLKQTIKGNKIIRC